MRAKELETMLNNGVKICRSLEKLKDQERITKDQAGVITQFQQAQSRMVNLVMCMEEHKYRVGWDGEWWMVQEREGNNEH